MQMTLQAWSPPRWRSCGESGRRCSGKRRRARTPTRRSAEQPQLHSIQSQVPLEQWEHGKDSLAVSVVEERYSPQHRDDIPAIARRIGREARGPGDRHPTILARSVSIIGTADRLGDDGDVDLRYDAIILGGGAAGLMCAIKRARAGGASRCSSAPIGRGERS